ncbi:hypothetical protein V1520DRAFT_335309 [Lipomyces starkeyi]|uniref:Uncharacterized protein n=1 Tax=Lipomyces starkeyi NRRL Y-11557 TaxID=675824 RepID=A0A1E3QB42_LIPST|nr:hypothetical protein LIPSTDRAFT_69047 [Lipomyces starkeyi NRRL Y-11557]
MSAPGAINSDYNSTVLDDYGYQLYSNGTLSNGTNCFLSFGQFYPVIADNGTVYNGTSCNYPFYAIKSRGAVGLVLAILSIVLLPVSMYNLRKHGTRHTNYEHKRFRLIGRRWQWYWLILVHILAAVAGFMSIDIDRDYIQGTSLTSYGAVFSTILPTCLASVWEMTRHWGSFEERRLFEADPFRFRNDDRRSMVHLLMPIIFYLFGFLLFLLTVLRNWSLLIKINLTFIVDNRWKAGVFFGLIAWLTILTQIGVTYYYYDPAKLPWKIPLCFVGVAALVAYSIGMSFQEDISPFNPHAHVLAVALWGYLPVIYIMVVMNVCAYYQMNDDLVILKEKDERDQATTKVVLDNVVVHDAKTSSGSGETTADTLIPTQPQRAYTNAEIKAFARANMRSTAKMNPAESLGDSKASC